MINKKIKTEKSEINNNNSENLNEDYQAPLTEQTGSYFLWKETKSQRKKNLNIQPPPFVPKEEAFQIIQQLQEEGEMKIIVQEKRKQLESQFPAWFSQLFQGNNLLFYGFGSKIKIIHKFTEECLSNQPCCIFKGFIPTVSVRNILEQILKVILDDSIDEFDPEKSKEKKIPTGLPEQTNFIKNFFKSGRGPEILYIIIHNIDSEELKNSLNLLSHLAEIKNIKMIASVEHINSPAIWDIKTRDKFKWIWTQANTYEPYLEEIKHKNHIIFDTSQDDNRNSVEGAIHVLQSLTENAQKIFVLLAKHQLEQKKSNSNFGLSFSDYYSKSKNQYLVNSELTFKAQLNEFKDHKLLISNNSANFFIPLKNLTLKFLIEKFSPNEED